MRQTRWITAAAIGCLLASSPLSASEDVDCAAIDDPDERLACYDRRFRTQAPEPPAAASPAEQEVTADIEVEHAGEPAADPVGSDSVGPAAAAAAQDLSKNETGPERTFLGDEKMDFTSTITAIKAGDKQKMVFLLENDQVWIQSSPRPLPFQVGDTVNIRNALLGGYFMRTPQGTNTRVQRIQ